MLTTPSYHSVRIDAVHYCEREVTLSEKRHHHQRRSFRKPSVNSVAMEDVPAARLSLFCRTVRGSRTLAEQVEFLKLPYMTRETSKAELAATVSALPNLKYVDLPEGAYTGDSTCVTLMNELQARCPQIRKMSYHHGSEVYLESLTRRHWQFMEELELSGVSIEPGMLRVILASLPALRRLSIADVPWLGDTIFQSSPNLPAFPALHALALDNCPHITGDGLSMYLETPANRELLSSLRLSNTGVTVPSLPLFLFDAPRLHTLNISASVSFTDTLPLATTPLLQSISLQELTFDITSSNHEGHATTSPSQSFYVYLCRSLHANGLPALHSLHVRDPYFSDLLVLPQLPSGPNQRAPQLSSPLTIYAKGLDEQDPLVTHISPPVASQLTSNSDPGSFQQQQQQQQPAGLRSSVPRPLSAIHASRGLGPQWSGGPNDSVMVGNGFGGLLAVPREDVPRPRSASADRSTTSLLSPSLAAMSLGSPRHSLSAQSQASGRHSSLDAGTTTGTTPSLLQHPWAGDSSPVPMAGSWAQVAGPMPSGEYGPGHGGGHGAVARGGIGGLVARVGGGLKPAGVGKDGKKADLWR